MEGQNKQRTRKIVRKTKEAELVRSVKATISSNNDAPVTNTNVMRFQNLWR